jgi:TolA-binding protein
MLMTMVPACSPVIEKPQQNDFFEPVNRVVHKKSGSDSLVISQKGKSRNADDILKDSLIALYQQQNKRLGDMMQDLNVQTKKNNTIIPKDTDELGEILANRDHISNEILLEKIKDQNQHLNDVVEQLTLLSKNQQNRNENLNQNFVTGANAVSVTPPSAKQIPVLITDANAVSVKPAPAQKVFSLKPSGTSINYGKAIGLYKSQQYVKAIDMFEKLLSQRIEPNFADRYHFWMGVCYFNLNKSNQAIREFTRVLGFAHSEKAEEAYFMMGQCYERTGAKNSAKMTYEKMLRLYPQGNLKQVVEKKLALLK